MGWTIPDKGEGDNDIQSILFQEYLDGLVDGINGKNCVLNGCAVTGSAGMTPSVAKGAVLSDGTLYAIAAATVTITTANATNPRIDLIVVTSGGALAVRTGTAAANPKPPARTANDVILAAVYVPANDTVIATSQITDMRVLRETDIVVYKTTTAVTRNTTLTIQDLVSITIPSGMLAAAGRILRFRAGGTYLSNSGTPTWTFTISYGGTTFFADATAVTAADTDRKAWSIEFDLVHTASNAQYGNGKIFFQTPGTVTAPTTGIAGDLAVTTSVYTPFKTVAGTVDSDAANRILLLQVTMSVSNASVETVLDYAYAELL